jgi:hypothetical protein
MLPRLSFTFAVAAVFFQMGCDMAKRQFTYTASNGAVTITKYNGSAKSVIIPDKIDGLPVTGVGPGAFAVRAIVNSQKLTGVTIPKTVGTIEAGAFANCTRLSSLAIPASVTNLGAFAFADCQALTSFTIPDSVTTIGEEAFNACIGLTIGERRSTGVELRRGSRGLQIGIPLNIPPSEGNGHSREFCADL